MKDLKIVNNPLEELLCDRPEEAERYLRIICQGIRPGQKLHQLYAYRRAALKLADICTDQIEQVREGEKYDVHNH